MNTVEFAKAIRNGMFADRNTVDEAYEYAYMVAKATDNPAAVMAAVQVVVNTLANAIETLEAV